MYETRSAELIEAAERLDAASRAVYAAQEAYLTARAAVVVAARAAEVKSRVLIPVGEICWYIDPPSEECRSKYPDGWMITWGGMPPILKKQPNAMG